MASHESKKKSATDDKSFLKAAAAAAGRHLDVLAKLCYCPSQARVRDFDFDGDGATSAVAASAVFAPERVLHARQGDLGKFAASLISSKLKLNCICCCGSMCSSASN